MFEVVVAWVCQHNAAGGNHGNSVYSLPIVGEIRHVVLVVRCRTMGFEEISKVSVRGIFGQHVQWSCKPFQTTISDKRDCDETCSHDHPMKSHLRVQRKSGSAKF